MRLVIKLDKLQLSSTLIIIIMSEIYSKISLLPVLSQVNAIAKSLLCRISRHHTEFNIVILNSPLSVTRDIILPQYIFTKN